MNSSHQLTAENMLRTLPDILKNDKKMLALASSIAEVLEKRSDEIRELMIYSRIDELSESLLDILAYDFKVDWWDCNYTLAEKRQTLKDSWHVHRHLGTKYAVETALSVIYPDTVVREWFEYNGKPYHFKLSIPVGRVVIEQHRRVLALVDYYKNLRSHLESIEYVVEAKSPAVIHMGGQMSGITSLAIPELPDKFHFESEIHTGGQMSASVVLAIPEATDNLILTESARIGGRMAIRTIVPIPCIQDEGKEESIWNTDTNQQPAVAQF